jgi:hypothetical protein
MRRLALLFLLALLAPSPRAQENEKVVIQPKQTKDYDENRASGYCMIRIVVDDEVNVYVQGGQITLENVRGQMPRDAGTECSQPMPKGDALANFQFKGISGRGRVQLIEEPTEMNEWRAWIRIVDPKAGPENHLMRVGWDNAAKAKATA